MTGGVEGRGRESGNMKGAPSPRGPSEGPGEGPGSGPSPMPDFCLPEGGRRGGPCPQAGIELGVSLRPRTSEVILYHRADPQVNLDQSISRADLDGADRFRSIDRAPVISVHGPVMDERIHPSARCRGVQPPGGVRGL